MSDGFELKEIAIVIIVAGLLSIIFKRLRLPQFMAFLGAGFVFSPSVSGDVIIKNASIIANFSELGVIFMMFFIGLEFSLQKLKKTFSSAFIAVTMQCLVMIPLGIFIAPMLELSSIEGIFIGCLLTISSSMVAIEFLKDKKQFSQQYAILAVGKLAIEDIFAIAILVILSGIALTGHFEIQTVGQTVFGLSVFVVFIFFLGRLIIGYISKKFASSINSEMLTVLVIGLILGLSSIAHDLKFSGSLGAFLAGSIVADTVLARNINSNIAPFRSIFTALFFVSVGMKMDLGLILDMYLPIIAISFCLIFLRTFACWFGLVLMGTGSKTGFNASVTTSHIGEFSFVIASLGQSMGVISPKVTSIAIGVSLITILSSQLMFNSKEKLYDKLSSLTPKYIKDLSMLYKNMLDEVSRKFGTIEYLKLIKKQILQIVSFFLLFMGIMIASAMLSDWVKYSESNSLIFMYLSFIWLGAAAISLPFILSIIAGVDKIIMITLENTFSMNESKKFLKVHFIRISQFAVFIVNSLILLGTYLFYTSRYFNKGIASVICVILGIVLIVIFWRKIRSFGSKIEYMFIDSFNQDAQDLDTKRRLDALSNIEEKYPWPVVIKDINVEENTFIEGKTIKGANIRNKTGATILAVMKNDTLIFNPSPELVIFADITLVLGGTSQQVEKAIKYLQRKVSKQDKIKEPSLQKKSFDLSNIYVPKCSFLDNETLAGASIRNKYNVSVLGIKRADKYITSIGAEDMIKGSDILLSIGKKDSIERLQKDLDDSSN